MKEVRWTETAKTTLQETSYFLIETWNSDINESFLDQLDYHIEQLQRNPELGPVYKNSNIRRLVIHKSVSLFYRNTQKYIKLLVVWDNRQNSDDLLDKLTSI